MVFTMQKMRKCLNYRHFRIEDQMADDLERKIAYSGNLQYIIPVLKSRIHLCLYMKEEDSIPDIGGNSSPSESLKFSMI